MVGTGVPQTERVESILDAVATLKFRDLGYSWAAVEGFDFSTKKDILKDVYIDISQNPQYKAWTSSKGVAPCLATSTMLYSYGRDRTLAAFELTLLQGHRRSFQFPDHMKCSQIKELAGEGIFLPCLATVIWSAYLLRGLP